MYSVTDGETVVESRHRERTSKSGWGMNHEFFELGIAAIYLHNFVVEQAHRDTAEANKRRHGPVHR